MLSGMTARWLVCFWVLALAGCSAHALDSDYDWTSAKIRGAYFYHHCGPGHFKTLADNGFNCGMVKLGLDPGDPFVDEENLAGIARLARGAAEAGVKFMPVLNWAGGAEVRFMAEGARRYVIPDGREFSKTPCPNDPRHWKHAVEARIMAIGDLGMRDAIAGVLIDPEMYSADTTSYSGHGCLCDQCWAEFLAHTRVAAPVDLPRDRRAQWLRDNGKDALYRAHQEQVLVGILGEMREALRPDCGDLALGFLNFQDTPFCRALARGLGTPERPVLILPETTYCSGYNTVHVDGVMARLADIGAHTMFIPGLWISKWQPNDLTAEAYFCAAHAHGYWLFTTYSLTTPSDELKGDYQIPADPADYWEALRLANSELDRLAADAEYETALKIGARAAIFPAPVTAPPERPALVPLGDTRPEGFKQTTTSRMRRTGTIYLHSAGGPTKLRLSCIQLGPYRDGLTWGLFDPDNEGIARGQVGIGKTEEIEVALPAGELCTLVLSAGQNTFAVDAESCHEAFPTTSGLRLCGRVAPMLYFYVPPGVENFVVHIRTGAEEETVRCEVISPTDQIVAGISGGFPSGKDIEVNVPVGARGKLWRLSMGKAPTGVLEDVALSFSEEIPPYVSEAPDRLLLPE